MLPDYLSNGPHLGPQYMPYFYAAGLFVNYNIPQSEAQRTNQDKPSTGYDFTSDLTHKSSPKWHQTVEDIIRSGYLSVPKAELETAMISDKQDIAFLGLDDVITQVRSRYEIYQHNMYEIEQGKCYMTSSMLAVEAMRGGVRLDSREAYSLSKGLREFYQLQRDERVRLWQDISRLKQVLPEHAQSYLGAYRKLAILETGYGDVP